MQTFTSKIRRRAAPILFAVLLVAVSWHTYRFPLFDIDMLGYMANVTALETSDAHKIHAEVYGDLPGTVPEGTRAHLLGLDNAAANAQSDSLKDRASNDYHFVEFLPCFAIRPLYIEILHIFRKLGVPLVRVTALAAVLPFFALGVLLFIWSRRYVGTSRASMLALLLAISPPTLGLARYSGPDCFSTLWAGLSLYVLFERQQVAAGLTLLLSCIYIRTDNVLLVLAVIAYLSLVTKQADELKAATLALVAVASVFTINHFAGDYGWRMLYYRGFIAAPLAPGEFVAHFSFADYTRALRSGIGVLVNGHFIPYLLFGMTGYLLQRKQPLGRVFEITIVFSAIRFLIFPLVEDRYFGLYYVVTGLTAISAVSLAMERTPYWAGLRQET